MEWLLQLAFFKNRIHPVKVPIGETEYMIEIKYTHTHTHLYSILPHRLDEANECSDHQRKSKCHSLAWWCTRLLIFWHADCLITGLCWKYLCVAVCHSAWVDSENGAMWGWFGVLLFWLHTIVLYFDIINNVTDWQSEVMVLAQSRGCLYHSKWKEH